MSAPINPINLANPASIQPVSTGEKSTTGSGEAFASMFQEAIGAVTSSANQADQAVQNVLSGRNEDIHNALVTTQQADLTFQLFLGVRNKITSAYQSIMGMQL